jgi:hypothetical protein
VVRTMAETGYAGGGGQKASAAQAKNRGGLSAGHVLINSSHAKRFMLQYLLPEASYSDSDRNTLNTSELHYFCGNQDEA